LVDLYRILLETPGVLGARFSGAGFRGCCLALVLPEAGTEAAGTVRRAYARRHPDLSTQAGVILCESDDGARFL
jgi:galactokinase